MAAGMNAEQAKALAFDARLALAKLEHIEILRGQAELRQVRTLIEGMIRILDDASFGP